MQTKKTRSSNCIGDACKASAFRFSTIVEREAGALFDSPQPQPQPQPQHPTMHLESPFVNTSFEKDQDRENLNYSLIGFITK